jgi:hypothetical protein
MLDMSDSIDGQPLVTHAGELLPFHVPSHTSSRPFPYHRLPVTDSSDSDFVAAVSSWAVRACLRPEVVYGLVLLYLLSEKPVLLLRSALGLDDPDRSKPPHARLRLFVAGHNALLCAFSAAVAAGSWSGVIGHLSKYGTRDTYCDPNGTLWTQYHLGWWCTLFYLSKYYEWIDTWILVLKKGRGGASFLQTYHHAGIVLAMYGGVASHSSWLAWVVLLNSVIHTVMYLYFFVKTLKPSLHVPAAQYLTQAQMLQFVIGIVGTLGVLWMGDRCDTHSSRASLVLLQVYGWGLLALFAAFHRRKYRPSTGSSNTYNKDE